MKSAPQTADSSRQPSFYTINLSELKRKTRQTQQQLQLITCRINHIESKEKQNAGKAFVNRLTLQKRLVTRLKNIQYRQLLKEHKQKDQVQLMNRTQMVRIFKEENRQAKLQSFHSILSNKRRISNQVREVVKNSKFLYDTRLINGFNQRKMRCLEVKRGKSTSLRKSFYQNQKRLALQNRFKEQLEDVENDIFRMKQQIHTIKDNLNAESQKMLYCKQLADKLDGELLEVQH